MPEYLKWKCHFQGFDSRPILSRKAILEILRKTSQHMRAKKFFSSLINNYPGISRAVKQAVTHYKSADSKPLIIPMCLLILAKEKAYLREPASEWVGELALLWEEEWIIRPNLLNLTHLIPICLNNLLEKSANI